MKASSISHASPSLWQILLAMVKRLTPSGSPRLAIGIAAAMAVYWLSNNKRKAPKKVPVTHADHTSEHCVELTQPKHPYQPTTPPMLLGMIRRVPNVDYRVYPEAILTEALKGRSKTIGDLHGNVMKLLWDLIYSGIISGIDETDYQTLCEIYDALSYTHLQNLSKQTAAEFFSQFCTIINKITLANQPRLLRLIGDVLCDRGSNDALTLLLLDKLDQLGLPIRILLSNHDMACFNNIFRLDKPTQGVSELAMLLLMNLLPQSSSKHDNIGVILNDIIKKYSTQWLYLVDSELNCDNTVTLYTHTLATQDTLRELAELHNTKWQSDTAPSILASCQRLNSAFKKEIETSGGLASYFSRKLAVLKTPEMIVQSPLYRLTWNRDIQEQQLTAANFPSHCYHIYGHNGAQGIAVASKQVESISHCIHNLCNQPNTHVNFNLLVCLLHSEQMYRTPIIYFQCLHKILHYLAHDNPDDRFIIQLQQQHEQLEKWVKQHHLHQTACIDSDKGKQCNDLDRDQEIKNVFEKIQATRFTNRYPAIFKLCTCIFVADPLWASSVAIALLESKIADQTLPHIDCVSHPLAAV